MELTIHKVAALVPVPTKRSWGECWWTSRDICITNIPELPDWMQEIAQRHAEAEDRAFILGSAEPRKA